MKIVVPVDNDKQSIVKRTGQAPFFAIYEDGKILEYVPNSHGHLHHDEHEHNHNHEAHTHSHKHDTQGISHCDLILVQAIGENMREALESYDIRIKKVRQKDGSTADELINNFLNNNI